mgnify:FL=1
MVRSMISKFILGLCLIQFPVSNLQAEQATPPTKPAKGYGSGANYLCEEDCGDRITKYKQASPKRVSYWIPKKLKNGDTAPVVVFLHGFFAVVPEIYEAHIDHLVKQGYIVIFPQFQGALWNLVSDLGLFKKADHNKWLKQAIDSTDEVLTEIGDKANRKEIFGYGHSIGGLLFLGWDKRGGAPLKGMVLANPKVDMSKGMPKIVRKIVKIKELPWKDLADGANGKVIILNGDKDEISTPKKSNEILDHLVNAESVTSYVARSHSHGEISLEADHLSPMTNGGILESLSKLMESMGGSIETNAYDHRYYFAYLDALLDGHSEYSAEMGHWSDGTPFNSPLRK